MNLSLYIAKRYIFSKKSHNAINVISMISVIGIAIATMAMVCTLSIFNGLTDIVSKSFSSIDPELRIEPVKGKVFDPTTIDMQKLKSIDGITLITESLEENALITYNGKQVPALVKGISENFVETINVEDVIFEGKFAVKEGDVQFGVVGIGLAAQLALRNDYITPLEIYSPKRDVKVNLSNPSTAFTQRYAYPAGIFLLNQTKYDDQVVFVSLELARDLFRYEKEVSSLNVCIKDPTKIASVEKELKAMLGNTYSVKDRFEQQAESFKMVSIEKWVTYLILIFILIIAVFNIIGSLSMLILDKENDIRILQKLGANNQLIVKIFMIEGWLISFAGAVIGLLTGLLLCFLQEQFGLLKLEVTGTFITDAYPVSVQAFDIALIFFTVCFIGFVAVLYPINNLRKHLR